MNKIINETVLNFVANYNRVSHSKLPIQITFLFLIVETNVLLLDKSYLTRRGT